jgi:glucose 1-dehydrogenase
VNITSVAGERAWPEDVAYNASKAGVEMLTGTIAVEYAAGGVRANCHAPGVIDARHDRRAAERGGARAGAGLASTRPLR